MVPNCQQLSWTHLPFIPLLYLWFFFFSHLQININWAWKIYIAKNKLMICCGKEAVKEICFTKLLQLILLPGGTSLMCAARAADQKHMINKRKTRKQIPISSFTSFNPCLTSGIAPHSEWLSPKFSSWNKKINKWSHMILLFRYQQQKSWHRDSTLSSAIDLLCDLQEITLPPLLNLLHL